MNETPTGQVVTFYSFKGGTGRTMALANVAWILAASGKRVLVADWDLESPGLHRFFRPFLSAETVRRAPGVIDMVRQYEDQTLKNNAQRPQEWQAECAKVSRFALTVKWEFGNGGRIDFLTAGNQNNYYAVTLGGLDWDNFYNRLGGADFFTALRANMKQNYDYTLIDSRTGLSDVADICTLHLPDTLVDCFTFSEQGIDGAAQVAAQVALTQQHRKIRVLPVPMRVDPAEKERADAGRSLARQRFIDLPSLPTPEDHAEYWKTVEVPYRAFYAYEEILATFGDVPGSPNSMLGAYEKLTSYITDGGVDHMPPMDEVLRLRELDRFKRRVETNEILLRYHPRDEVWAEWIERLLVSAGVKVTLGGSDVLTLPEQPGRRTLSIISADYRVPPTLPEPLSQSTPLAVYVADVRPSSNIALENSAFVVGQPVAEATARVLRLVGRSVGDQATSPAIRYPGEVRRRVFTAPARNPRFTGRDGVLRDLRTQLRSAGTAVVLPVAVQGQGGVGKTQLALEYAHRFATAYDVVWWVNADPPEFVDSALLELGERLGLNLDPAATDNVRLVLQSLGGAESAQRWLLIFDNAEVLERVAPLLPHGGGHVLITSRNREWSEQAQALHIDVFKREESISHLQLRLPSLTMNEAERIAAALGDLPIAVAAAGALLAESSTPIADYLRAVEDGTATTQSVQTTWTLSLNRLAEQSPAAYRMLQLCSVLASEVAFDLLNSHRMGVALAPTDPAMSEPLMRGVLTNHLNKLALIKLDTQARQIHVHRLLQQIVQERMTPEDLVDTRHEAHLILAAARPDGEVDDPKHWAAFRLLWPHLVVSEAVTCTDANVRRLLIDRVRFLHQSGEPHEAESLADRIGADWIRRLTEDGETDTGLRQQLLELQFNVANILRSTSRFQAARSLDESVLAQQRRLLGPRHPQTLRTNGSLAADLRGLGEYAAALAMDSELYEAWVDVFGEHHNLTLNASNNLAVSHRLMGDYRAALERDQATFLNMQELLGESHPSTLTTASNLGRDLRDAARYEESVSLLQRMHADIVANRGADRVEAFLAQANLAVSLRAAGEAAEALALLQSAYEQLRFSLGPEHPQTRACQLSRALTLLAAGQNKAAESELRTVVTSYTTLLGEEHPHTLICMSNLAAVLRSTGNADGARELAQQAAEHLALKLAPDHPFTLAAQMNHAVCMAENDDLAKGAALTAESLALLVTTLGQRHADTLRCRANLALMRQAQGAAGPEARPDPVINELADAIGEKHPSVNALRLGTYVHRVVDPHPY
ncbi:hypothetical protein Cme02nite_30370 [Catellatospora methionotrophica]|uniref:Tetratricopeptide repeat protein n=1 Tax=Catellatospora methionotrophica TaxID=121620 RepID=A0A8J3L9H4_9ACTN|nr:FxSxx-COOH system tetratricopeptide repeat protein [Catellatospora methionotrophica]GIG14705.1 hypothetical protein Cme02nite_30370 [Catellatospora methionotrophica]